MPEQLDTVAQQAIAQGQRIREERGHQQLSLRELSAKAGIGQMTLVRIEAGHPGVSQANLLAVLHALGLPNSPSTAAPPPSGGESLPLHPLHINSDQVVACVDAAVSAACRELDQLFPGEPREKAGISSNFLGLLAEHIRAMLLGDSGARITHLPGLKRLVYSDRVVGGPKDIEPHPDFGGWVLRLEGTDKALQDGRELGLNSEALDPYSSRQSALDRFQLELARFGHPPRPVSAVPVYWLPSDRRGWLPGAGGERA